jgi:hypothetical protein
MKGAAAYCRPLEGGCACEEVRYRIEAPPLFVHCCHCSWCQRETGSAFAVNVLIEASRVTLVSGDVATVTLPSASGRGQRVTRCPTCLVVLWSTYAGAGPGILFLRAGTLDRAADIVPDIHIYTSTRLPWVEIPKGARSVPAFYDAEAVWQADAQARYRAARGAAAVAL